MIPDLLQASPRLPFADHVLVLMSSLDAASRTWTVVASLVGPRRALALGKASVA
jgi:hypothetical protein